jgi:hypothetical protein
VGHRARLDIFEKRKISSPCWALNHNSSTVQPTPTTLFWFFAFSGLILFRFHEAVTIYLLEMPYSVSRNE